MPSLLDEFSGRREAGQGFGKSLKNAIFQAKSSLLDLDDDRKKPKFKLWKVHMRSRHDEDPV
jgi:potassium channel subfamily K, other eukaryote